MTLASTNSADFNRRLFGLADRLAARDIVVTRLHVDWSHFGSWELWTEAGAVRDRYDATILKGINYHVPAPDVLRFSWDGRDSLLGTAMSLTRRLAAPTDWVIEPEKHFAEMQQALAFAEAHAIERLSS